MTKEVAERTEAAVAGAEQAVAAGNVSLAEFSSRLSQSAKARASTKAPDAGAETPAEVPEGESQQPDGEPEAEAETDGQGEQAAAAEVDGEPANGESGGDGETGESGGDEGPEGNEGTDAPKGFEKMQKRINQLTARAKAGEERVAELEAKLAGGKEGEGANNGTRQEPRPTIGGGHPALAPLDGEIAMMNRALAWTKANPEGGVWTDPDGTKFELDAEKAASIRESAMNRKGELIAERTATAHELRRQHAEAEAKFTQEALAAYSYLTPTATDEASTAKRREFEEYARMMPEIRRFPDWKNWVADAMAGREARLAKAKGAAAGKKVGGPMVKPKSQGGQPAPIVARPGSAAPRVNPEQKAVKASSEEFVKSGSTKSLARMFSASAAARRKAA